MQHVLNVLSAICLQDVLQCLSHHCINLNNFICTRKTVVIDI